MLVFLVLCLVLEVGLVTVLVLNFRLLKTLIARMRVVETRFSPGSPGEMPELDLEAWERRTDEMRALGFRVVEDHHWRPFFSGVGAEEAAPLAGPHASPAPLRHQMRGFERLMVHPEHGCLAGVLFTVLSDRLKPAAAAKTADVLWIGSYCGFGDDDWSCLTSDARHSKAEVLVGKLARHPRRLVARWAGEVPTELLQKHLERREQVARAANISWQRELTAADEIASEARQLRHTRAVYQSLTPRQVRAQLHAFKREKGDEWLGELKGRL